MYCMALNFQQSLFKNRKEKEKLNIGENSWKSYAETGDKGTIKSYTYKLLYSSTKYDVAILYY